VGTNGTGSLTVAQLAGVFRIGSHRIAFVDAMFTKLLEPLFTKAHEVDARYATRACLWQGCIAD
jgi:hypothetical protein